MIKQLPAGRVTFAFTDVVGSTRAFEEFGERYVAALRELHAFIASTVAGHGGTVVSTEGDGAFLAFPTAGQALDALCRIQTELEQGATSTADGSGALALRLRAGAHTGHATPLGDEYVSLAVHVAARVAATANAGQVVVSQSVQHDLDKPRGSELGRYRLKDIPEPLTLWLVAGPDTPLRATPDRTTNVAAPRTSFIGRADELGTLRDLVAEPGIVTLTGPGGLGKTRLATELALSLCDRLPGGAWLVELAAVEDPGSVPGAVAAAIGAQSSSDSDAIVRELSRRGDVLLVLDNCEHLVDAVAELVIELAENCPGLRVICTSREPLEIDGERVLRLRPLDSRSSAAEPGDAERLFLERAAAAGATVGPDDLAAVARACRQLDGLPLALELAAARLTSVPAAALAEALETGEIRLQRRGGQRRQRSLTDLVGWSVRLLEPGERTALQVLSMFPGRFDAAAAKEVLSAVPGATAGALPELTRRSLVDLDGDRYRLLVTIRSYAAGQLSEDPPLAAAASQAFYDWALRGCPEPTALAKSVDDFDTAQAVLVALNWGLANDAPGLHRLMRRIRVWADRTGGSRAVRELAVHILDRPTPVTAPEVILQCVALDLSIGLGWHLREGVQADVVERLIAAARAVGDVVALFQALAVGTTTMSKLGRHEVARELGTEAVELTSREPQLALFRGMQLGDLGLIYYAAGDLDRAEPYMRQALEVTAQLGDDANVLVNHCNLGELLIARGDPRAAIDHLRVVVQTPESPPIASAVALGLLVEAEHAAGEFAAARDLAAEAESELVRLAALDPSLTDYLERLRALLNPADVG